MLTALFVYVGVEVIWLGVAASLNVPPGDAFLAALLWPLRALYELGRFAALIGD